MPKKTLENLTEPMLYILMALSERPMCGAEIAETAKERSKGRVKLGPATIYTLLAKFQEERLITEISVEGRKRSYRLTDKGRAAFAEELARLRSCVKDGLEENS